YTVEKLKEEYPGCNLSFIAGADSLLEYKWYRLDDLLNLLEKFFLVTRPGYDMVKIENHIDSLGLKHTNKFREVLIPGFDISSSVIRERIKEGKSIRYMVPEAVEKYIKENKLYSREG
ncbi:MAG: nicotinic acid mononucleotide adenylyltransferase, partial [Candidatus Eremiobacteraeota bacterium]|nr:nicotinic acid mononucleotide adenylyltransferase [Candidatus Eremiobacteraeota bacterium]